MKRSLVLIAVATLALPAWAGAPQSSRVTLPLQTKKAARTLLTSWIEAASPESNNALAYRSAAFTGLIPRVTVVLDGRRQDAGRALNDCALVLLGENDHVKDLRAIRDSVYVLNEIAEGRTYRQ